MVDKAQAKDLKYDSEGRPHSVFSAWLEGPRSLELFVRLGSDPTYVVDVEVGELVASWM
jgi:hypothetical protein